MFLETRKYRHDKLCPNIKQKKCIFLLLLCFLVVVEIREQCTVLYRLFLLLPPVCACASAREERETRNHAHRQSRWRHVIGQRWGVARALLVSCAQTDKKKTSPFLLLSLEQGSRQDSSQRRSRRHNLPRGPLWVSECQLRVQRELPGYHLVNGHVSSRWFFYIERT